MQVFAVALNLSENFFDAAVDDPISAVRALNYPHQNVAPQPGQLRAGAHSDYGSLTILRADAAAGGLEIFNPQKQWQAGAICSERLRRQHRRSHGPLD